jgi:glycosyltransferase involved in cell wall biosynthesis
MKISIITVVYNGEKTIRDCINSVLSQTYADIEYIIVDGKSTDRTLEIVESYGEKIKKVISEPDSGIYDAMNKGIRAATGDIIGILNADDMYASNDVLEKVAQEFEKNPDIGCVYGDLEYVDKNKPTLVKRFWKSHSYVFGSFKKGWHPPHPSFFIRKGVYEKYGLYRTDLKIASDYEMMLRLLEIKKVPSVYIPETLVKMRTGGVSNRSIFHIIKANIEVLKAWKINGQKIPYLIFLKKPLSKILQIK